MDLRLYYWITQMTTLHLKTIDPFKKYIKTKVCTKCDDVLKEGDYRAVIHGKKAWEREVYCPRCVAWIDSRYTLTYHIPDMTEEEKGWARTF